MSCVEYGPGKQLAPFSDARECARNSLRIAPVVLHAELDLLPDQALPRVQPVGGLATKARVSATQREAQSQPPARQRILTS